MNSYIVLGALALVALIAFKIFGKLVKIAVLLIVVAIAAIYFLGGKEIGGVTIPSFPMFQAGR